MKSPTKDERTISYLELYRYADPWDCFLIILAIIAAFIKALVHPFAIIVYSELAALFIDRNLGVGTSTPAYTLSWLGGGKELTNATHAENMAELRHDALAFGILIGIDSAVMFFSGIAYVDIFNRVALRLVVRMRRKFFEATIRQDIGWHDVATQQNFALLITDNMEKIRNGIAENVGHFTQLFFDIIISIVIAFVYGWKLTLVVSVYIPITILINMVVTKYQSKLTLREQNSYACAGSMAEEVIGAIRTVVAFDGEKSELQRYEGLLMPARKAGKRKGIFTGLSDSVLKAMMYISSAAAFWYGTHLILESRFLAQDEKEYTPANLSIVIFGIIVGADHISRLSPFLEAFALARGSAVPIFEVIDAKSNIDPMAEDGKVVNYGIKANITFQEVFFRYPAREDAVVLHGLSLTIREGQTVALVGHSGSGKSTCIQLLQRFYDPIFGKILLDNEDLRKYNVSWLRSNMAVVGQEPVLFQGTIGENIRHGKPDATQKEIEDSARAAGAHDFIISLANSYNTEISEKGIQLSGGQRQRIAIARALIMNPKILLLDEATSALDYHSEKLVQAALDKASKGRTTLVVSHRLSAICNADHIVFIDKGKVVEQGNHAELMQQRGKYYDMVTAHEYDGDSEELLNELTDQFDDIDELKMKEQRKLSTDMDAQNSYKHLGPRFSSTSSTLDKNIFAVSNSARLSAGDDAALQEDDSTNYPRTFLRIVASARPEWGFLLVGTFCACIYGCSHPAFSIIFAELYAALVYPDEAEVLRRTGTMATISAVVGVVTGLACFVQTYFFNLAGVWLTTRMRAQTFEAITKQEIGWFDETGNSVGALSARLAGDASSVQGAIGFPLSNIIQAVTNFIFAFAIAFYYSWELALVCLCTSPFMIVSIIFEARFMAKCAVKEKEILEETSRIATESIAQIRTVTGLRLEPALIKAYNVEVARYEAKVRQRLRFRGLVNSLGMSIMFLGYAITLSYGGFMNSEGRIEFAAILKISSTMLYGLFLLAQSLAFTPAFNAAIISANRIYQITDREPKIKSNDFSIDQPSFAGDHPDRMKANAPFQGVRFGNVHFRYPTRRQQPVLRGFNLDVLQGKTVALVGPSGSGKSTCVQLLLRYYDPDSGKMLIDDNDIHHDLTLSGLRRRLGIVSQEPSLFEKTIAENIAYGDTARTVPLAEVMAAAKMANAHDFITALPNGYDTCLGAKGTQLSGGQKQRIAIARALVRNPKILLLDEATSALDLQSERVVQSALDEACSGRTCIVIAHRLSTVQKADVICVIQHGRIVEAGNHPTLLAKNGIYAKLYQSQPKT